MNLTDVPPGEMVTETACWSCGAQVFKTVPRHRPGAGLVLWRCDCGVAWSEPPAGARRSS